MTAGDMLRSVVPVYPPEGSDVVRAGSLPGEPSPHVQPDEVGCAALRSVCGRCLPLGMCRWLPGGCWVTSRQPGAHACQHARAVVHVLIER